MLLLEFHSAYGTITPHNQPHSALLRTTQHYSALLSTTQNYSALLSTTQQIHSPGLFQLSSWLLTQTLYIEFMVKQGLARAGKSDFMSSLTFCGYRFGGKNV